MIGEPRWTEKSPAQPHISRDFFKETCEYTDIGPLTFLPMMESPQRGEIKYTGPGKLEDQPWLRGPLAQFASDPNHQWFVISDSYATYYQEGDIYGKKPLPEPPWIKHFDPKTQAMLRRQRSLYEGQGTGQLLGGGTFQKVFGFACFLDYKKEQGILRGVEECLHLRRLLQISQLAWLTVPAGPGEMQENFQHNRYYHSCNVLAVASLIGTNCGLSSKEMKTLQVAAYTHDAMTPAGGDRTKAIDPEAFDEDKHYLEAFTLFPGKPVSAFSNPPNWNETKKHLPDEQDLAATIQEKGTLGSILDIADKISYVGSDAAVYIGGMIRFPTCLEDPDYQEIEGTVEQAMKSGSSICAPWQDVKREKDKIYFDSPERLGEFLKLRALMFKNLYYNPRARNVAHVLASLAGRTLYQKGLLTREKLLTMNDLDLEIKLRNYLWDSLDKGFNLLGYRPLYPEIISCASPEEAREKLTSLQKNNLVLFERFHGTTSTGDHLLTKVGNKIVPFSEAYPEDAEELRRIFRSREGYVLYSVPFSELSLNKDAEEALRECQATQVNLIQ